MRFILLSWGKALTVPQHTSDKTNHKIGNTLTKRTQGSWLQADREGRAQELADYYLSSQLKASNDQLADKAGTGLLTPEMNKELAVRSATTTNFFFGWKTILKVSWLAAALAEQHYVWALKVVHEVSGALVSTLKAGAGWLNLEPECCLLVALVDDPQGPAGI